MNLSRSTESVPHRWSTQIDAMVYSHGALVVNRYYFTIGFFHTKQDATINQVAFEKIEIFFNGLFGNSIIIDKETYEKTKIGLENNIFMLPEDTNDQSIGSLIYLKLCALMKEDLAIEFLTVSSTLGKDIEYTIDAESEELLVYVPTKEDWWKDKEIKFDPWWLRDDSATYDVLINANEIFTGEFAWDDLFKEEIEKIQKSDISKGKFKIIDGGKNVH